MRLEDKICIITGAGCGLGKGAALRFACEGAKVALNDINQDYLKQTAKEINNDVIYGTGDASDEGVVEDLVQKTLENWGRIDVLFANAGKAYMQDPTDMSLECWNEILKRNLTSSFLWIKHVLPAMLKQKKGSVILMSSMTVHVGLEFNGVSTFAYAGTKAGSAIIAKSLATRYGKDSIRFNAICPGHIKTKILNHALGLKQEQVNQIYKGVGSEVPLGREGTVEELINGVLFLASDEASYMTGQELVIDGGVIVK